MELSKSLLKKWVAALRSGKYFQGQDTLCEVSPTGVKVYCCLGVLCDISKVGKWKDAGYSDNFSGFKHLTYKVGKKSYKDALAVDDDLSWTDLTKPTPGKLLFGMDKKFHKKLIKYNDEKRMSFKKIAYEIERHFHLNGR